MINTFNLKALVAKVAIFLILLTPVLTFLHYFLPRSAVVELGQPYVKRMDNDNNLVGQGDKPVGNTRDVFFITTYEPGSDQPLVMRNEDTGWSFFPPYFKFNSADLNAKASKLDKQIAKVRYYGFRIEFLSIFPNVLSIEAAQVGDSTFPWARTVFGTLVLGVFGYVYFLLRNVLARLSTGLSAISFAFGIAKSLFGFLRKKKGGV